MEIPPLDPTQTAQLPLKIFVQPKEGEVITSLATGNTYTIGGRIGEGSFGIVYFCQDEWKNELAVKVLKPVGTYERVKASAEAEIQKLLYLRHPHITYVYDAFEYRDTFYIVTEKCLGPLSDLFTIPNYDGIVWLLPVARCLLQALHYIHRSSFVHQDIHLRNVFTTFVKDEMPSDAKAIQFKLADLGVAKLLNQIDAANTRAQWMLPPEALRPQEFGPIDHQIDIYHTGLLFLQFGPWEGICFYARGGLARKTTGNSSQPPRAVQLCARKVLAPSCRGPNFLCDGDVARPQCASTSIIPKSA